MTRNTDSQVLRASSAVLFRDKWRKSAGAVGAGWSGPCLPKAVLQWGYAFIIQRFLQILPVLSSGQRGFVRPVFLFRLWSDVMDTNGAESERAAIVAELARVKALFQLRTIAAVIGAPMPVIERGDHIKESGND